MGFGTLCVWPSLFRNRNTTMTRRTWTKITMATAKRRTIPNRLLIASCPGVLAAAAAGVADPKPITDRPGPASPHRRRIDILVGVRPRSSKAFAVVRNPGSQGGRILRTASYPRPTVERFLDNLGVPCSVRRKQACHLPGVAEMAGEAVVAHSAATRNVGLVRWLTTTNHHDIGILYIVSSLLFFLLGGILALLIRWELAYPGETIVDAATYNALFTMHGTTMIFLVAIPLLAGFGNLMVPPMIGADDMAFPRINALSFWLIPPAGVILWLGSAQIGWTGYAPLSVFDPSVGVDMWIVGLQLIGISSTMGIVVLATPVLAAGLFILFLERHGIASFLTPATGGDPIVWQHIFWFYSHPAVYIMILPVMGIIPEVTPRMSQKPIFGYKAIALSSVAIGFLGFGVWAHHMFTTGMSLTSRVPFMVLTLAIAVPSGIKVFNWIMTMWGGAIEMRD